MLKRLAAVAICLLAIWAISLERTYAWLGLQSAYSARWLEVGMHPFSFDFTSNMRGDVRWQLIGQGAVGATIKAEPEGLHVQPLQSSFELRLNLAGARLIPEQITALVLDLWPQRLDKVLPKFSLAVHAGPNDPGWIAELDGHQWVDLEALVFKREPARLEILHWRELPPITHLRLYGTAAEKVPFILATMAFKIGNEPSNIALTSLRPEALLQAFDAARATTSIAATGYRGLWLAPIMQMWISVVSLTIVLALLGFDYASDTAKLRASARALLVMVIFLPIITMLWGNVDWPVESSATLAPQWFALGLSLLIAIGYRWINMPPRITRLSFDARTIESLISCAVPTIAVALVFMIGFSVSSAGVEFELQHVGWALAFKYLAFAAFQQWLLQTLVWANLRRAALARQTAILLSALLFALLHTPNFMLMFLCFFGALFWCGHYAKYRRLLPLILSHAFLGFLCVSVIPTSVLRSADIGVAYFLK